MMKTVSCLAALSIVVGSGCSNDSSSPSSSTVSSRPSAEGLKFLLDEEPTGAKGVIAVRGEENNGDQVVVVGRIGGSKDPWVEGRAAFSIVDNSLKACSDIDGDDCLYPWDYCCETDKLPTAKALVKFVDEEGMLLQTSARVLFAVKELQTVVIRGTAQRDDTSNLIILADGMFVRN